MSKNNKELEPVQPEKDSADEKRARFMQSIEHFHSDLLDETGNDESGSHVRTQDVKMNMLSSIPMRCAGNECVIAAGCPLVAQGRAPVGEMCPIEQDFIREMFLGYAEELEVDLGKMVEVSMLRDLVDQEVQQVRKSWMLGQEDFIQDNVVGVDEDGNVITKRELHQAVDYEDRLLKRKKDLRNALLATRESKSKAGQDVDGAIEISQLISEVRQITVDKERELRRLGGVDSYIDAHGENDDELEEDIVDAEIIYDEDEQDDKGDSSYEDVW